MAVSAVSSPLISFVEKHPSLAQRIYKYLRKEDRTALACTGVFFDNYFLRPRAFAEMGGSFNVPKKSKLRPLLYNAKISLSRPQVHVETISLPLPEETGALSYAVDKTTTAVRLVRKDTASTSLYVLNPFNLQWDIELWGMLPATSLNDIAIGPSLVVQYCAATPDEANDALVLYSRALAKKCAIIELPYKQTPGRLVFSNDEKTVLFNKMDDPDGVVLIYKIREATWRPSCSLGFSCTHLIAHQNLLIALSSPTSRKSRTLAIVDTDSGALVFATTLLSVDGGTNLLHLTKRALFVGGKGYILCCPFEQKEQGIALCAPWLQHFEDTRVFIALASMAQVSILVVQQAGSTALHFWNVENLRNWSYLNALKLSSKTLHTLPCNDIRLESAFGDRLLCAFPNHHSVEGRPPFSLKALRMLPPDEEKKQEN